MVGAVVLSRGLSVLLKDITVPLVRLNVDKVSDQRPQDTYAIGIDPINSNIQGRSPNVVSVISHSIRNCF